MATGNYGIVRPSDVRPSDVEIFYGYSPSRDTPISEPLNRLSTNFLTPINSPDSTDLNNPLVLGGLYRLELPATIFNSLGFYTIYIRPREIKIRITDCGVLSIFPDVKGIILDTSILPNELTSNNSLIGYRIEYFNGDGTKINNLFRVITSSNRCEPVNQNLQNSNQKSIRYRFNNNSSLLFCTLTPSSAPNVKPNETPFIGTSNQIITLNNTFFNPVMIEVELAEHDFDTLAIGIFGNSSKSIVDGKYTLYDKSNQIYKQYNLFQIQDEFTGKPLFEVKEETNNIDFDKDFNNIVP
jgi:hypothetical protein